MAAIFALALAPQAARADPAAQVEAALKNIVSLPRSGEDGYATVWDGNKYVQCGLAQGGGFRCGAAGTLMQPSLRHVLDDAHMARLTGLGWRLDMHFGNFVQTFPARMPAGAVAALILRTLQEGYDADLSNLEVRTAWVASEPCPPRNGYTQNLAGMINDAPQMARYAVHDCRYLPAAPDKPVGSSDELVTLYGERVSAEIQRLRVNLKADIFTVFQAGIGYIQCHPDTSPDVIYCEAQSAESWAALSAVLTPDRIARLHAAGYADPGRAPNYWKNYPVDKYDDAAIAREILTLLHDVYGYDAAEPLKFATETGDET